MAKRVLFPGREGARRTVTAAKTSCPYAMRGRTAHFDCRECPSLGDAPDLRCLEGLRSALNAHPELEDAVLQGEQDVWLREKGLEALRSIMAAETAWEEFRDVISSLPCPNRIAAERISSYFSRVKGGSTDLFCRGEGDVCHVCLERQRRALQDLRSDRNRARRTLAVDRFRITEVKGGDD